MKRPFEHVEGGFFFLKCVEFTLIYRGWTKIFARLKKFQFISYKTMFYKKISLEVICGLFFMKFLPLIN